MSIDLSKVKTRDHCMAINDALQKASLPRVPWFWRNGKEWVPELPKKDIKKIEEVIQAALKKIK